MYRRCLLTFGAVLLASSGCAPKAPPLTGPRVSESLPSVELEGSHRLVFRWRYADATIMLSGEGIARVSAPDSARLDFFVDGGLGGGVAFLLGDSLVTAPNAASIRRVMPPPALMWAALGRLALPASEDTVITRDGDTVQAELGTNPRWRVTLGPTGITRLVSLRGSRIHEYVNRGEEEVLYENPGERRSLRISIQGNDRVSGFSEDVWPH